MRATLLSSGGMTKRLDRLADAGLVERRPDPSDRRGTRVRLTEAGRERIDRALEAHLANEERLLVPLTAAERERLDGLLRKMLLDLEERRARGRGRDAMIRKEEPGWHETRSGQGRPRI